MPFSLVANMIFLLQLFYYLGLFSYFSLGIFILIMFRVANGSVIERALMDYVLITKRMVGRLKDVHVFRGVAAGMSDHFLVEAKVVVAKEWGNGIFVLKLISIYLPE